MLLHLHVKNLALIRETEIDFTDGLNILTGETGAGKSIIIGSITMALGQKVPKEMLREEDGPAVVELIFQTEHPELLQRLEERGIQVEDGQVILSRKISGTRSLCRINSETVSTAYMKETAAYLIDIHGQHEHQSLLHKRKHLEILDDYAHEQLQPVKASLIKSYQSCQKLEKELREASTDTDARLREQSLLEYEIQEIEDAHLKEGEDEQLEQDYRKMTGSKRILEALTQVQKFCMGEEISASEQTGRACRELVSVQGFDEGLDNLKEQLQEIDSQLQDFGRELMDYMEGLEFSDQDFYDTEERLNLLNHLKAKYGATIADVLAYQEEKQKRLDMLANYDSYMASLQKEYETTLQELKELCQKAHKIRMDYAGKLTALMKEQLAELNFLDVQFEIAVHETEHLSPDGFDDVEFLISTNPGEPLKALGKIASGGELSRVMLAIKTVLADQDAIDTVIFDEIDAGISGRTAQKVSEKLALIGRSRQVICITHLAQIASMADSHYCIEKQAKDGGTQTQIRKLRKEEITEELARILGGAVLTDTVYKNAEEMRDLALAFKRK